MKYSAPLRNRTVPEARGFCMTRLSHISTLQLIEAVRKHAHLWDQNDKFYGNYDYALASWNTIITELFFEGCTDADCAINTWSNLLYSYFNHLKRPVQLSQNDEAYLTEMDKYISSMKEYRQILPITQQDFYNLPIVRRYFVQQAYQQLPCQTPRPAVCSVPLQVQPKESKHVPASMGQTGFAPTQTTPTAVAPPVPARIHPYSASAIQRNHYSTSQIQPDSRTPAIPPRSVAPPIPERCVLNQGKSVPQQAVLVESVMVQTAPSIPERARERSNELPQKVNYSEKIEEGENEEQNITYEILAQRYAALLTRIAEWPTFEDSNNVDDSRQAKSIRSIEKVAIIVITALKRRATFYSRVLAAQSCSPETLKEEMLNLEAEALKIDGIIYRVNKIVFLLEQQSQPAEIQQTVTDAIPIEEANFYIPKQ